MSSPNYDSRYSKPADVAAAIAAQATTDAGQYVKKANNLSDIANVATARSNLGLAQVASTGSYLDLSDKPTQSSSNQPADFNATDAGFAAWTIDPIFASTNVSVASGNLILYKFKMAKDSVVSNITLSIYTTNTGITSSFAGIYNSGLNLIGQTADQGTSWNTAGVKTMNLATPTASLTAGTILYAAVLAVGGAVTYRCAATALTFNSFAPSGLRLGVLSGQTVLPASITLASVAVYSSPIPIGFA